MRASIAILAVLFLVVPSRADEIAPTPDPISTDQIRLPILPQPEGPPTPQPVTEISTESWYVIDSDVELIVLASRVGFVSVSTDEGPMKLKGKFADGSGKVETRTYTGKHIYTVEAVAQGQVELLIVPVGVQTEEQVLRRTLSVVGPRPPPVPPGPTPVPIDPPVPTPTVGKLRVLIIEETESRATLPASQIAVLTGAAVRDYCKSHCLVGPDGRTPEFRVLDDDQDVSRSAEWIQKAFQEPRGGVPFLVVSNGTTGWAGPLPATEEETLQILKRYGGE